MLSSISALMIWGKLRKWQWNKKALCFRSENVYGFCCCYVRDVGVKERKKSEAHKKYFTSLDFTFSSTLCEYLRKRIMKIYSPLKPPRSRHCNRITCLFVCLLKRFWAGVYLCKGRTKVGQKLKRNHSNGWKWK